MQFYDHAAAGGSTGGVIVIKSIGELRTRIRVREIVHSIDEDGFNKRDFKDVFGSTVWCKWIFERGTETFESARQRLMERAAITMRYNDKIDERCVIEREGKPGIYWEVVSVMDVDDRHRWMEVTLKRSTPA